MSSVSDLRVAGLHDALGNRDATTRHAAIDSRIAGSVAVVAA
jgi:hypothetical protein